MLKEWSSIRKKLHYIFPLLGMGGSGPQVENSTFLFFKASLNNIWIFKFVSCRRNSNRQVKSFLHSLDSNVCLSVDRCAHQSPHTHKRTCTVVQTNTLAGRLCLKHQSVVGVANKGCAPKFLYDYKANVFPHTLYLYRNFGAHPLFIAENLVNNNLTSQSIISIYRAI